MSSGYPPGNPGAVPPTYVVTGSLTGLPGGVPYDRVRLVGHPSLASVTLTHESESQPSVNRFWFVGEANRTLRAGEALDLEWINVAPDIPGNWRWVAASDPQGQTLYRLPITGTVAADEKVLVGTNAGWSAVTLTGDLVNSGGALKVASLTGALTVGGELSPTALAANTDDYAPTGFASALVLRLTSSAAVNLTGIAGGSSGRTLLVWNLNASDAITLKHDTTSTAGNRFYLPGAADFALTAYTGVLIRYDGNVSRWLVLRG